MYGDIFNKFKKEMPNTRDSVVAMMIYECFKRMELFDMNKSMLLEDNVTISISNVTGEVDIRQNEMFGIFWSFDTHTGELVGT